MLLVSLLVSVSGHKVSGTKFSGRIGPVAVFCERELTFTFAICCRPSVCLSFVCLSVCLSVVCRLSSVTFVRPTQAVQIFGNISTAFRTLAIR